VNIEPDVDCPHCGMVIICPHTPPVPYPPHCINTPPPRRYDYERTDDFIENMRRRKAHEAGERVTAAKTSRSQPTDIAQPGNNRSGET
jgi:hypothetical protein